MPHVKGFDSIKENNINVMWYRKSTSTSILISF